MDDLPAFNVDLTNPDDMAAKLAKAENILDGIMKQLAEVEPLQRKAREWTQNVEFLRSKVGAGSPPVEPTTAGRLAELARAARENGGRTDVQKHVVGVVNREMRKIKSSLVRDILADEGYDFSAEQVSNALHHAATGPKLIQKWPERGMYAPLGYREAIPVHEPPKAHAWPAATLTIGGSLPGR